MNHKSIEKLVKSPEGQEFMKFLVSQIRQLDRVSNILQTAPEEIALETLARKRASVTLAGIFKPFLDFRDTSQDKEEQESDIYYNHLDQQ